MSIFIDQWIEFGKVLKDVWMPVTVLVGATGVSLTVYRWMRDRNAVKEEKYPGVFVRYGIRYNSDGTVWFVSQGGHHDLADMIEVNNLVKLTMMHIRTRVGKLMLLPDRNNHGNVMSAIVAESTGRNDATNALAMSAPADKNPHVASLPIAVGFGLVEDGVAGKMANSIEVPLDLLNKIKSGAFVPQLRDENDAGRLALTLLMATAKQSREGYTPVWIDELEFRRKENGASDLNPYLTDEAA